MIARLWHGVTMASKADAYLDYLNTTGVPDDQATAGNRGGTSCVGWRETRRMFSCSRSGTPARRFNEFPLVSEQSLFTFNFN
jgi:hypothetical protein